MTKPLSNSLEETLESLTNKPFVELHLNANENIQVNQNYFMNQDNNYRVFIHNNFDTTFEELKEKIMAQFFKLGYLDIQVEHPNIWMSVHQQNENSYISLVSTDNGEFIIEGIETEIINFLDELHTYKL